MKIVDILNEAPPGYSQTIAAKQNINKKVGWLKKQAAKLRPEDTRIAKQNQKKWYDTVKQLQRSGKNIEDEDVYRKALYAFLSSNDKFPLSDKLKQQINTVELSDYTVLDIMKKTVAARREAKAAKGAQT